MAAEVSPARINAAYRVLRRLLQRKDHPRPDENKRTREIALPDFLVEELRHHLEAYSPVGGLVFTGRHGGQIDHNNFRSRIWYPALEKAEIAKPWPRVHHLRHTMVSLAMARGIPQGIVQARAGHATSAMTDRYTHLRRSGRGAGRRVRPSPVSARPVVD